MIRRNPRGDTPVVHETAFVDHTAILCGMVIVHENVFIGPYAVIRADEVNARGDMEPVVIGANSNIQDGVVIHSKSGALVSIGKHTTIAPSSMAPARWAAMCLSGSTRCCSTAWCMTMPWCATVAWWTGA